MKKPRQRLSETDSNNIIGVDVILLTGGKRIVGKRFNSVEKIHLLSSSQSERIFHLPTALEVFSDS